MTLTHLPTVTEHNAVIERVLSADYKIIKASREYAFDWVRYKHREVYKLCLKNSDDILGLIVLIPYPQDGYQFLEIEAIEVGISNRGSSKTYDKIAGCLIAYGCRHSIVTGCTGVVMLVAKTEIAALYHTKYGFQYLSKNGTKMVSDYHNSTRLIENYLSN